MPRKKKLDYLVIPDSGRETKNQRIKRAIKELKHRKIRQVLLLKGRDSEEDILYLGKILKKGDRIGFDTFQLHYKEYREIIKKAKKQRKFPKGVKIENVKTTETFRQHIFGFLGLEEEKIRKGKVDYVKNRKDVLFQKMKDMIKRIISI